MTRKVTKRSAKASFQTETFMRKFGHSVGASENIAPLRPLPQRLEEYARRHGLRFRDRATRYELSWDQGATRHVIEIDKATAAVRSGTVGPDDSSRLVYQSPPSYLGASPLEELLEQHREFGAYDKRLR